MKEIKIMFADEQIKKLTETAAEFEAAPPVQHRRVIGLLECAVKALEQVKADTKA